MRNIGYLLVLAASSALHAQTQPPPPQFLDPHLAYPQGGIPPAAGRYAFGWGYKPMPATLVGLPNVRIFPAYGKGDVELVYLGYNDRGTWVWAPLSAEVLLWNGSTIEPQKIPYEQIPADVFAPVLALDPTHKRLAQDKQALPPAGGARDPNFPYPAGRGGGLGWFYPGNSSVPIVFEWSRADLVDYYGFNDTGSFIGKEKSTLWLKAPAYQLAHVTPENWNADIAARLENSTVGYRLPK